MEKKDQWNIGYWIVAGLLLLTLQNYWQAAKTVEPVPYSEFEKALAEGRVAEVLVSDRTVTGRLKSPDSRGNTTIVATRVEPGLAERLPSTTCLTRGWWKAPGYVMCSPGFCRRWPSSASGSSCSAASPRSRAWAAS
jgi:cell division protease FtsH